MEEDRDLVYKRKNQRVKHLAQEMGTKDCGSMSKCSNLEVDYADVKTEHISFHSKLKRRKRIASSTTGHDACGSPPTRMLRSRERVQEVVTPTSALHHPRTVLSWLIDNKVVLPRQEVQYCSTKGGAALARGLVSRKGILCNCCEKVLTLGDFQIHAGCSNHRPSANIFLEDGKSLLDCQTDIMIKRRKRIQTLEQDDMMEDNSPRHINDCFCTVCQDGGELLLCDLCPSAFHIGCIGLKVEDIPDGEWYCPACCCGICSGSIKTTNYHTCGQCECTYHTGCLRERHSDDFKSDPRGNWLCSHKCRKIYLGLQGHLGKQIPVGVDNLTWSLLKSMKSESDDTNESDYNVVESYSRLNLALQVINECFKHFKKPRTGRDLAEDIIFGRRSDINGMNFQGFYIVLLEKNDALITVAAVRIYGAKVAEVPLLCTRLHQRGRGMCRLMLDLLEKMLMELGVERLVLPILHKLERRWNEKFGFSNMVVSERLQLLHFRFMEFLDTYTCQKYLPSIPLTEPHLSNGRKATCFGQVTVSRDTVGSEQVSTKFSHTSADPPLLKKCDNVSCTAPLELMCFRGLANLDKTFIPLVEEVCSWHPCLIECQKEHTPLLAERAFTALGRVLHFLKTKKVKDMNTHVCEELRILWDELQTFGFELSWMAPHVEKALGMSKFVERAAEIKKLREDLSDLEIESKRLQAKIVIAEIDLKKANEVGCI